MKIMGISGSYLKIDQRSEMIGEGNLQDSSACLVDDGRIVSAIEEERLNRIKHSNKFPINAMKGCVRQYRNGLREVDQFAFSMTENEVRRIFKVPDVRPLMQAFFSENFGFQPASTQFSFFDHHYSHAASCYYTSGMTESLVMTIDARGGEYSSRIFTATGDDLISLRDLSPDRSLGYFYSNGVAALGFGYFDEYKVMGLAPYGDPSTFRELFKSFYSLAEDGNYRIDWVKMEVLNTIVSPQKDGRLSQIHMDVAAALQEALEAIVFHELSYFQKKTGHRKLCLAGGVAQNCTMNGKIARSGLFDEVFVFPASNDSGLSVGASMAAYVSLSGKLPGNRFSSAYLGLPVGSEEQLNAQLSDWDDLISFRKSQDITREAAQMLAENKVIGWVQGQSEFGPRALGNRSILAHPAPAENKDRINAMVKKREAFRPFAPVVLEEFAQKYFDLSAQKGISPFMTFVVDVRKEHHKELGAVTHVDGTARVQTVARSVNPRFWQLIDRFREITGVPILLNTSFNNNAEPIVDSVTDAIICFLTTKIDYLVVSDFIMEKKGDILFLFCNLYCTLPRQIIIEKVIRHTIDELGQIREAIDCFITNSYNDDKYPVSSNMYDCLLCADGSMTLMESMARAGGNEQDLVKEFWALWEKRLILLRPLPVKQPLIERSL